MQILEHGKLDNGGRQNEALDALFCLINLAFVYSQLLCGRNTLSLEKLIK
jgi:hypothetical protein